MLPMTCFQCFQESPLWIPDMLALFNLRNTRLDYCKQFCLSIEHQVFMYSPMLPCLTRRARFSVGHLGAYVPTLTGVITVSKQLIYEENEQDSVGALWSSATYFDHNLPRMLENISASTHWYLHFVFFSQNCLSFIIFFQKVFSLRTEWMYT